MGRRRECVQAGQAEARQQEGTATNVAPPELNAEGGLIIGVKVAQALFAV
jgi:hypothetical protein